MRRRPVIVQIEDDVDGDDARVTVTLDWDDRSWHGHALGSIAAANRLAGEATLMAVDQLTGSDLDLELLAIAASGFGESRVALAQVRFGDDEVLVGSALERGDDGRLAAVRAVMDAINRRLELVI